MTSKTLEDRVQSTLFARTSMEYEDCGWAAKDVISEIEVTHHIEPRGRPIDPGDVRKGDRVRVEWANGDISVHTATSSFVETNNRVIYLLDRTDADANFVFPEEVGSLVQMFPKLSNRDKPLIAVLREKAWVVTGFGFVFMEKELRNKFRKFTIIREGEGE